MKTSIFAILSAIAVSVAHAGDYLTDLEAGKKKAAAEQKALLVKFTGSDWCPPCIKLNNEVFKDATFKEGIEKNFVVVVLDYPRKTPLPAAQTATNKKLAKKYNIKSYPTVMLMDAEGKAFRSIPGYSGIGAKAYLAGVQTALKAKNFQ